MKIKLIFILLLPAFAFSQEKCVDLFSIKSTSTANHSKDESQINTKLEALVLLQFQIEQNAFEPGNQLKQAQESFSKQLQELIKIDPKHLAAFKKRVTEKHNELKAKAEIENKKKVEEQKAKDEKLKNYEIVTATEILKIDHVKWLSKTKYSPDGKYILTKSHINYNETVKIIEIATRKEVIIKHSDDINEANFSPDGKYLVTTSKDGEVRVSEVATGRALFSIPHPDRVLWAKFSPDGKSVLTMCSQTETVRITNLANPATYSTFKHAARYVEASVSPDGKYLATISEEKNIDIFDITTKQLAFRLKNSDFISSLSYSSDGKQILIATNENLTVSSVTVVRIFEVASGKEVLQFKNEQAKIATARFSPDNKSILTISKGDLVNVYSAETGNLMFGINHANYLLSAEYSPNGKYILTVSADSIFEDKDEKIVKIRSATTGSVVTDIQLYGSAKSANFGPDSEHVVAGSDDNTARVFKLEHTFLK